jgi:transposase
MSRREAASYRRVSVSTVRYWIDRYRRASEVERADGSWALDRPSTPHRQPARVSERVHDRVCAARRRTGWGPRLIAAELGMAHATVSRCVARRAMSRRPPAPREAVGRFEWPCPGDLLHMDTKRLARFTRPGHALTGDRFRSGAEQRSKVGWEFCHSMIDDHARLADTEICPDETAGTVTAFVERALDWFAGHGIHARRLQTDNAFAYVKHRSLRELLARRGIQHRRIPPRTPKRNGKVERYQQTLAREWAYGQRYRNSTLPRGGAAHLARALQLHPQPQLTLKPAAHQPRSERVEAEHLERAADLGRCQNAAGRTRTPLHAVTSSRSSVRVSAPGAAHRTTSSPLSASSVIVESSGMSPARRARPILVSTSCWM